MRRVTWAKTVALLVLVGCGHELPFDLPASFEQQTPNEGQLSLCPAGTGTIYFSDAGETYTWRYNGTDLILGPERFTVDGEQLFRDGVEPWLPSYSIDDCE